MKNLRRSLAFYLATTACALTLHHSPAAYAETEKSVSFNITAPSLGRALNQFAQQSNRQIIFGNDVVITQPSRPLRGSYSVKEALEMLLRGSGLDYRVGPDSTIIVARPVTEAAAAAPMAPIRVAADAGSSLTASASSNDSPALDLEEIIVNARRVEENVQRVPIAITALPTETLERKDVHSVIDLNLSVPGLNICCAAARGTNVWLRGVPGIVAYFSEVPTGVPGIDTGMTGNALFFDLENTSVLKGPQGTLFGLSTTGGAILLQPRRPSENFDGYVYGVGGSYGRRTLEGAVNVPVIDDKLFVRVGAMTHSRDGYITNLDNGIDLNNENYHIGRFSSLIKLTDTLENYTVVNYYKSKNRPLFSTMQFVDPNGTVALVFGYQNVKALVDQQLALGRFVVPKLSAQPKSWSKQLFLTNTTTWDVLDNLTLKNVFGYVSTKGDSIEDQDAMNLSIVDGFESPAEDPPKAMRLWTHELQAQGAVGDLSYTVGTFNSGMILPHRINMNRNFNFVGGSASKAASQTHALFAQATYDASAMVEGLSVTGGYRYTWDIRRSATFSYSATRVPLGSQSGEGHFNAGSYTLGVQYQHTPNVMFFLTNSKSTNSGGFNLNAPPAKRLYQPESLNNLEGGVKAQWRAGDMQFRTNLSAFHGWYSDIQVTVTQFIDTPSGPVLTGVIDNAAVGRIKGIEGDFAIIPNDWLELSGNFLAMKAHYTEWNTLNSAGQQIDFSGARFLLTPNLKFSLSATAHLPVVDPSQGDVSLTVDYTWEDERNYDSPSLVFNATNVLPSRNNLDITLSWSDIAGHEGITGSLFVSNVTKEIGSSFVYGAYGAFGLGGWGVAPPRMWGARLRYDF